MNEVYRPAFRSSCHFLSMVWGGRVRHLLIDSPVFVSLSSICVIESVQIVGHRSVVGWVTSRSKSYRDQINEYSGVVLTDDESASCFRPAPAAEVFVCELFIGRDIYTLYEDSCCAAITYSVIILPLFKPADLSYLGLHVP